MREIKFRVFDTDNAKYLTLKDYETFGAITVENDGTLTLGGDMRFMFSMMIKLDKWVVEQYIGIKDKNGAEIYEGDILKRHCVSGNENSGNVYKTIKWLPNSCRFNTNSKISENYEVIGNIHEEEK